MKIGYIINDEVPLALPRGDAIHITNFIDTLAKLGHTIFLIRKNTTEIMNNKFKIFNIEPSIKFWKFFKLSYNIELYIKGSSIINNEKPEILHERENYLYFGGFLLACKYKIPYVLEVNAPLLYERGRYHSYISCKFQEMLEKKMFEKANKIIVVSNILKNYLISIGVPFEKIVVVPNGADGELFNPNISGQDIRNKYCLENKKVVCYSGSLDQQWQGIEYLIKAAKIINSIDLSVKFLIIGNTTNQEEILKKVLDNVIFTGSVSHADVPLYLAAADVLVAPYIVEKDFEDIGFYNSPIKLFEYMAMGKAIVTSNIGQISEIIDHGRTGLLIKPGNHQELANNILMLIRDNDLREALGSNARIEFERNFTWEKNARRIISIYEDLLQNKLG